MSSAPKFSVIIPARNEENYILDAIRSVKDQETNEIYKIIVGNNGCLDNTGNIASSQNIKIVNEPQKGVTFAKNKGADFAEGNYLVSMDSDCRMPKDHLKKLYTIFKNTEHDCVGGPLVYYDAP